MEGLELTLLEMLLGVFSSTRPRCPASRTGVDDKLMTAAEAHSSKRGRDADAIKAKRLRNAACLRPAGAGLRRGRLAFRYG
jgi:hypothetical protein